MSNLTYIFGSRNQTGYGSASTARQIAADHGKHIDGKHFFITGVTSGLGLETAKALAAQGGKLFLTARSAERGQGVKDAILKEFPQAQVEILECDLASMRSIKQCAERFAEFDVPLHVLINNAGVMACPKTFTEDGLEMQFGTNHIGHFLLTHLLLDHLKRAGTPQDPARVVAVSSLSHSMHAPRVGIEFDDLKAEKRYARWERYGSSKLANLLFAKELNRRMEKEGHPVIANALHPGCVVTDLARHQTFMNYIMVWPFSKSIPQGAATSVFAAVQPGLKGGQYFADCAPYKCHKNGRSDEKATRLWQISEELVRDFV